MVVMAMCARAGSPGASPSQRSATRRRGAPGDGRMISTIRSRRRRARRRAPERVARRSSSTMRQNAAASLRRTRRRGEDGAVGIRGERRRPPESRDRAASSLRVSAGRRVAAGIDRRVDVLVPAAGDLRGGRALRAARAASATPSPRRSARTDPRTQQQHEQHDAADAHDRPEPGEVEPRRVVGAVVARRSPPAPGSGGTTSSTASGRTSVTFSGLRCSVTSRLGDCGVLRGDVDRHPLARGGLHLGPRGQVLRPARARLARAAAPASAELSRAPTHHPRREAELARDEGDGGGELLVVADGGDVVARMPPPAGRSRARGGARTSRRCGRGSDRTRWAGTCSPAATASTAASRLADRRARG